MTRQQLLAERKKDVWKMDKLMEKKIKDFKKKGGNMTVKELKDILEPLTDDSEIGVSVEKISEQGNVIYVSDKTKVKVEFDTNTLQVAPIWITGEFTD